METDTMVLLNPKEEVIIIEVTTITEAVTTTGERRVTHPDKIAVAS